MSKSWTPPPPGSTPTPDEVRASRPSLPPAHGIRRILVCVDGSPLSEGTLPYAIFLARTFGAGVTLLHVLQTQPAQGPIGADTLGWEFARQEADAYVRRLADQAASSGQRMDTRVEQGKPAERIAATAREIGADLIVMGRHGESGVSPWSLGGTVQQVLGVTRASVLIARSDVTPDAITVKRILVPLDGSLRTESVLPAVARIANQHGAEVLLVHVVAEPHASAVLRAPEDLALAREMAARMESGAKRYLDALRNRIGREVASVRCLVARRVDERHALLDIARAEHSDMVVVSAHGVTCNPLRPFGSFARHLLTHSVVPLLVLQDLPERQVEADEEAAPPVRASFAPEEA